MGSEFVVRLPTVDLPSQPALPRGEPKPAPAPLVAASPVAPVPAGPVPGKIYTAEDTTVAAPVVVKQDIPSIAASLMALSRTRGLLDIVIDEQGRVMAMTMRSQIHPSYDALILTAARDWKYKPATFNGQPVRYRRLISINVKR